MNDNSFDSAARATVIDALLEKLREHYIDADRADQVEHVIRGRLEAGIYDQSVAPDTFCELLTQHLQEISDDKHLRLRYSARPLPLANPSSPRPTLDQGFVRFLRQR